MKGLLYCILVDCSISRMCVEIIMILNKDDYHSILTSLINFYENNYMRIISTVFQSIIFLFENIKGIPLEILSYFILRVLKSFHISPFLYVNLPFCIFILDKIINNLNNLIIIKHFSDGCLFKLLRNLTDFISLSKILHNSRENKVVFQKSSKYAENAAFEVSAFHNNVKNVIEKSLIIIKYITTSQNDIFQILGKDIYLIVGRLSNSNIPEINMLVQKMSMDYDHVFNSNKNIDKAKGINVYTQYLIPQHIEKMIMFLFKKQSKTSYMKLLSIFLTKIDLFENNFPLSISNDNSCDHNISTCLNLSYSSIMVDLVRFIITNPAILPEANMSWCLVRDILIHNHNSVLNYLIKEALFYDWLFEKNENIGDFGIFVCNISLLFNIINDSTSCYLFDELFEFLYLYINYYDPSKTNEYQNSVIYIFNFFITNNHCPKYEFILNSPNVNPKTKTLFINTLNLKNNKSINAESLENITNANNSISNTKTFKEDSDTNYNEKYDPENQDLSLKENPSEEAIFSDDEIKSNTQMKSNKFAINSLNSNQEKTEKKLFNSISNNKAKRILDDHKKTANSNQIKEKINNTAITDNINQDKDIDKEKVQDIKENNNVKKNNKDTTTLKGCVINLKISKKLYDILDKSLVIKLIEDPTINDFIKCLESIKNFDFNKKPKEMKEKYLLALSSFMNTILKTELNNFDFEDFIKKKKNNATVLSFILIDFYYQEKVNFTHELIKLVINKIIEETTDLLIIIFYYYALLNYQYCKLNSTDIKTQEKQLNIIKTNLDCLFSNKVVDKIKKCLNHCLTSINLYVFSYIIENGASLFCIYIKESVDLINSIMCSMDFSCFNSLMRLIKTEQVSLITTESKLIEMINSSISYNDFDFNRIWEVILNHNMSTLVNAKDFLIKILDIIKEISLNTQGKENIISIFSKVALVLEIHYKEYNWVYKDTALLYNIPSIYYESIYLLIKQISPNSTSIKNNTNSVYLNFLSSIEEYLKVNNKEDKINCLNIVNEIIKKEKFGKVKTGLFSTNNEDLNLNSFINRIKPICVEIKYNLS